VVDRSYSHIILDHSHDVSAEVVASPPRAEGWYLNPFDCREQMYWTGLGWTKRRGSAGMPVVELGFEVPEQLRDVRIRAEMHHRKDQRVPRRASNGEFGAAFVSLALLALALFVLDVLVIADPGVGSASFSFSDIRAEGRPPGISAFLFGYFGPGFVTTLIIGVAFIVAVCVARFGESGVPQQMMRFVPVFGLLGLWYLLAIVLLRNNADFGSGGLRLGAWLGPVGLFACAASAAVIAKPEKPAD